MGLVRFLLIYDMMMTHFIVGGGLNCTFCLDNPNKRLTLCGLCLSPSVLLPSMEGRRTSWKEQNCSFHGKNKIVPSRRLKNIVVQETPRYKIKTKRKIRVNSRKRRHGATARPTAYLETETLSSATMTLCEDSLKRISLQPRHNDKQHARLYWYMYKT